ncbi:MAG: alanine--tRNA ligase, partial [Firmicutes bacterium]|nr:alanine--tRNA ligase [Bacillota bacterium]
YGDSVRVVNVPGFSMEFCGGTHVANIGQIGCLHIVAEQGVAAGTRRITAVTGSAVNAMLAEEQAKIDAASASLKTSAAGLEKRAEDVAAELKALRKELEDLKAKAAQEGAGDLLKSAKTYGGARLIEHTFEGAGIDELRNISDQIKAAEKAVVMVFAALNGEKATLMVSVTDDLTEKGYHAGNMVKEIAKAAGGGGGGKADMAQAGAKDVSKLPDAFAVAEQLMEALAK